MSFSTEFCSAVNKEVAFDSALSRMPDTPLVTLVMAVCCRLLRIFCVVEMVLSARLVRLLVVFVIVCCDRLVSNVFADDSVLFSSVCAHKKSH